MITTTAEPASLQNFWMGLMGKDLFLKGKGWWVRTLKETPFKGISLLGK